MCVRAWEGINFKQRDSVGNGWIWLILLIKNLVNVGHVWGSSYTGKSWFAIKKLLEERRRQSRWKSQTLIWSLILPFVVALLNYLIVNSVGTLFFTAILLCSRGIAH